MAFVPSQMFMTTNGKTIREMVRIGAASDIPNHKTERNAQQTAGTVRRTMIQVSKNNSTSRFNPIRIPNPVPASMDIAKPSNIRRNVCATTA
jgi:hypothetical protein